MPSKKEQVADALERETDRVSAGEQVSSVDALMNRLGVSIGAAIRGVDLVISRGVPSIAFGDRTEAISGVPNPVTTTEPPARRTVSPLRTLHWHRRMACSNKSSC